MRAELAGEPWCLPPIGDHNGGKDDAGDSTDPRDQWPNRRQAAPSSSDDLDQTLEFDVIAFSSGPCDVIADSSGSTKDTVVRQAKPGTVTPTGGQMPRHSAVVEIARPLAL
jgi:hypothetical protein